MKIYRVMPDVFVTNGRLNNKSARGSEGIYYQAGYASFYGEMGYHSCNNIMENVKGEGKYFFIFPEDALSEANSLIGRFHRLNADTCLVVEYDMPEELVLNLLGCGDYKKGIIEKYLLECYIHKNDFGTDTISSEELSDEKKEDILIHAFNESLKRSLEVTSVVDILNYRKVFNTKVKNVIDNEEMLRKALFSDPSSTLYKSFMEKQRELIKSPYITDKVVPVNMSHWSNELKTSSAIEAYYQSLGIDCDFSEYRKDAKKDIVYMINHEDGNREKVKQLLREIKPR